MLITSLPSSGTKISSTPQLESKYIDPTSLVFTPHGDGRAATKSQDTRRRRMKNRKSAESEQGTSSRNLIGHSIAFHTEREERVAGPKRSTSGNRETVAE